MEKFSSLLDSVKERLSNPFFFSFILSWLIFNWQVPIGLATFNDSQLAATGCANYVEYIIYKTSNQESWSYPLYAALGYTLIIPLLMIVLKIFNALVIKLSNSGVFWVSKDTPVSFEKYIEIKDRYKKSTDAYATLIKGEKETFDALERTKLELNQSIARHNDIERTNADQQQKLAKNYTDIINDHNMNIALRDTQIETMRISIDELAKENVLLKNSKDECSSSLKKLNDDAKEVAKQIQEREEERNRYYTGLWKVRYKTNEEQIYLFTTNFSRQSAHANIQTVAILVSKRDENNWLIAVTPDITNQSKMYFFLTKNERGEWKGYLNSHEITEFTFIDSDYT